MIYEENWKVLFRIDKLFTGFYNDSPSRLELVQPGSKYRLRLSDADFAKMNEFAETNDLLQLRIVEEQYEVSIYEALT